MFIKFVFSFLLIFSKEHNSLLEPILACCMFVYLSVLSFCVERRNYSHLTLFRENLHDITTEFQILVHS
jgi:hypothetical protein